MYSKLIWNIVAADSVFLHRRLYNTVGYVSLTWFVVLQREWKEI